MIFFHQALFFCLMSKNRNTGPPTNAVITPTGSPVSPIFLAKQSEAISIRAPIAAEDGMRYFVLDPTNILAI